jgi:hypothetical protein
VTYTKEDVRFHSDGFRPSNPAVNVKVYASIDSVTLPLDLGSSYPVGHPELIEHHKSDPRFTHEWVRTRVSDDVLDARFWQACESEVEFVIGEAEDIFSDYSITVQQTGRMGGWLEVEGLPDLEDWDAVLLGKWRKFEKLARTVADDIPRTVLDSVYVNDFETWKESRVYGMVDA